MRRLLPTFSGGPPLINPFRTAGYLVLSLAFTACVAPAADDGTQAQSAYQFGSCGNAIEGAHEVGPVRSLYVPMRDGVPRVSPKGRACPRSSP